jgi:PIN domain nuclease of toxin-antitoxin system
MNFSIDTNVIIGIVNDKDRLHDISRNLMRDKQNEKLFICKTALKESQTVFRIRINEIMGDIIQFLPKFFQNKQMSLLESQILLIEIFKE